MKSLSWHSIHTLRLARNYLSRPAPRARLVEVVRQVCGIQAQVMSAAELALSARVRNLTQADIRDALWHKRTLVKTYGPRGTLHLLPADELPLWMAAMRAASNYSETPWYAPLRLNAKTADKFVAAIGQALDGKQLSRAELADAVAKQVGEWARDGIASAWADAGSSQAAFQGQLCFGPSEGARVSFVRADQWLGTWQPLDPEESLREILRRYLKTYGPATAQDFAHWFLLKPNIVHTLFQSLGAELEPVDVEGKRAYLLAADTRRPTHPTVDSTIHLVPQYDCFVLNCRFGRERLVSEQARKQIMSFGRGKFEGAVGVPLLLQDGIVAGMWDRRKRGKQIELRVESFVSLTAAQQDRLECEAQRIGKFFQTESTLTPGALA